MKKFLIISFILISVLGCSLPNSNGNVIIKIKKAAHTNIICYYFIDAFGINQELCDTCGKYNVGDTLIYRKK